VPGWLRPVITAPCSNCRQGRVGVHYGASLEPRVPRWVGGLRAIVRKWTLAARDTRPGRDWLGREEHEPRLKETQQIKHIHCLVGKLAIFRLGIMSFRLPTILQFFVLICLTWL